MKVFKPASNRTPKAYWNLPEKFDVTKPLLIQLLFIKHDFPIDDGHNGMCFH